MVNACHQNGVKLGVDLQNRHHPAHEEAKRLVDSGDAGEITLITAQYSQPGGYSSANMPAWRLNPEVSGGGVVIGMAIHCLDLMRFIVGKEIEEVTAISDEKWTGNTVDESIFVLLKFKDGPFGNVMSSSHVRAAYNDLVVYGTKARITGVNTIGMPLKGSLEVDAETFEMDVEYPPQKMDAWGRMNPVYDPITGNYVRQIEAFNRCIAENTEPSASGLDGMEMVRVINAIRESARTGRAVRLID
jgi:predicted dehydrogenase